jgi:hypothetical protein
MIWTASFWKGAGERAIKTFAQTLAAVAVVGVPVLELNFAEGVGLAATATLASLLTSIGNADFTAGDVVVVYDE